jgi:hypothetical protein
MIDNRYFGVWTQTCGKTHPCGFCYKDVKYKSQEIRIPVRWEKWDKGCHILCYIKALKGATYNAETELIRKGL